MPKRTINRIQVVLHFLGMNVPEYLNWADKALELISISPDIPNPAVPVLTAQNHLDDLRQTAATRLTNSSKALTDLQRGQVNLSLSDFSSYAGQVEQIANAKLASLGDV